MLLFVTYINTVFHNLIALYHEQKYNAKFMSLEISSFYFCIKIKH
jgi:hypothetical protein